MGSVTNVNASPSTKGATSAENLLPTAAAKRTSSTGVVFTNKPTSTGQSIFIKGKVSSDTTLTTTLATENSRATKQTTFKATVSAEVTRPLTPSVSGRLNASLGLTGNPNGSTSALGTVGAGATYTVPLSPTAKASIAANGSVNTNGVFAAGATLQATQKFGTVDTNVNLAAATSSGNPTTFSLGAGATIPLGGDTAFNAGLVQSLNGGGTTGTAGVTFNF